MPQYQKKYADVFRPRYFDNPRRQPQSMGRIKFHTQDPLYMDDRREHITGGIVPVSKCNKIQYNLK